MREKLLKVETLEAFTNRACLCLLLIVTVLDRLTFQCFIEKRIEMKPVSVTDIWTKQSATYFNCFLITTIYPDCYFLKFHNLENIVQEDYLTYEMLKT